MKTLYFFLISLFLLLQAGFKAIAQKSVFKLDLTDTMKLPALIFEINEQDLSKAYQSRHVFASEEILDDQVEGQYFSSVFYEDHKINDAKNLFQRYVSNNLMNSNQQKFGYLDLDVVYYNWDTKLGPAFAVNLVTFGFGFLVGLPGHKYITNAEVEMKIYDLNNNLLATYYGTGKDRYFESLYFHRKDQRVSNLEALKKAITMIDKQVKRDFETLKRQLLTE